MNQSLSAVSRMSALGRVGRLHGTVGLDIVSRDRAEAEAFLILLVGDLDGVPRRDFPAEKVFGEGILDVALDRPAHRTRPVGRVVALFDEEFLGFLVELEVDVFVGEATHHGVDLQIHDADEVLAVEDVEDDLLVEAVEELGFEGFFGPIENLVSHVLVVLVSAAHGTETEVDLALDDVGPHVGGENDDGVPEIDLAAEAVGDHALLKNLEEQVHDVRMGFFDFVEEHHGVGTATHRFGELAALFVSDITGRRTDETAAGEFLHVLGHVDLDERVILTDATTNEPLPGVQLYLETDNSIQTETNADGEFSFDGMELPLGEQILVASKNNYLVKNLPIVIEEGKTLNLEILLEIDVSEQLQIATISLSDSELDQEVGSADNIAGLLQSSKDV